MEPSTNPITIKPVGALASVVSYWCGMAAMLLLGMLSVVAVLMTTPLEPTRVAFDLLRAAVLGAGIVALFCWFIHREAESVIGHLDMVAMRNRSATLDIKQGQQQMIGYAQHAARVDQDMRHAVTAAVDRVVREYVAEQQQLTNGLAELTREMARIRGRLDGTLIEQNELLEKLSQRLAADVGVAYDLGAKSNGN